MPPLPWARRPDRLLAQPINILEPHRELKISPNLKRGDIVGIYTQKGEAVALAESTMSGEDICDAVKGYAFETKRLIMAPNTYPKKWRTKPTSPKD